MTTTNNDNAVQDPIEIRDIDTLLRLPSYSEMNDYEVDAVVQWKANNLADEYWRLQRDEVLRENIREMQERSYAAKEAANAAFERAMALVPQFEEVK
jgi:hypothetical protein